MLWLRKLFSCNALWIIIVPGIRGRPRNAISRCYANNPGNADALYLLGCLAHQFGSSLPASQLFYQAIAIAPNQRQYHNALGLALMGLEKHEGAGEHFQRAIALRKQSMRTDKL